MWVPSTTKTLWPGDFEEQITTYGVWMSAPYEALNPPFAMYIKMGARGGYVLLLARPLIGAFCIFARAADVKFILIIGVMHAPKGRTYAPYLILKRLHAGWGYEVSLGLMRIIDYQYVP